MMSVVEYGVMVASSERFSLEHELLSCFDLYATLGSANRVRVLVTLLPLLLRLSIRCDRTTSASTCTTSRLNGLLARVLGDGGEEDVFVDEVVLKRVDLLVFTRHANPEVPDANLTLTVATDELVVQNLKEE